MLCLPAAPLAQLAEQLTLNQLASGLSPEETGILEEPAAHSAVRILEIDDPQLMKIILGWENLSLEMRTCVSTLVATMGSKDIP